MKKTMPCILLVLVVVFIFAKVIQSKTSKVTVVAGSGVTENKLSMDEKGSISFEENKYFKKFSITLKTEIKDLKWNETKEFMEIKIDKDEIEKLAINSKEKGIENEIFAEQTKDKASISIKKKFNKNYVYKDFKEKNKIIVLVAKLENPYDYKVIVDPGHGEYDTGANYKNIKEKDITVDIALKMLDKLRYNGCQVVFTREKDIIPRNARNEKEDVRARAAIANEEKADLFISIHVNDFKDKSLKGITTYYYCKDNFQLEERTKLAKSVAEQSAKNDGWKNRGIKSENFGVLRLTNMPSVLVECGFMSNDEDRGRYTNETVLKNIADNISKGVINYFEANPKR